MRATRLLFTLALTLGLAWAGFAGAAETGLPLDSEQSFDAFAAKYCKLGKTEQLRYVNTPFRFVRLVDDGDEPEEKAKTHATMNDVKKVFQKWTSIMPTRQQLRNTVLVKKEDARPGEEALCWAENAHSSCMVVYTFKKIGTGWRLVEMFVNESGI